MAFVATNNQSLVDDSLNLTNCDREPIHIPGSIQPYGFLLGLDEHTKHVVQASANTGALLGIAAEELLGAGLERLLGPAQLAAVEALWPTLGTAAQLLGTRLDGVAGHPLFKLILHRYDQLLWVEGEPVADTTSVLDLPTLNLTLDRLLTAETMLDMCQCTVEKVREFTGFDRVAIYRFDEDESGHVIAEALRPGMAPWLGLHYPATDIPQQARAMFLKNLLRFIPDAAYSPVALVPTLNPATSRPPDMTHAVLRSASPVHLEYLHNMGSAATMTISLLLEGQLWGLITCHHESPLLVSYELRDLCRFLGKIMSTLLRTKEQQDERAYQQRVYQTQSLLVQQMSSHNNFFEGLYRHTLTMRDLVDCGGAAICLGEEVITIGHTPSSLQITDIVAWLRANGMQEVFYTASYVRLNPAEAHLWASASGLLAIALGAGQTDYILWFRPELEQAVTWAGRQEKIETIIDGQVFLSPRQSFEAWKQMVKNTSVPWKPLEVEAARELRRHVAEARLEIINEQQTKAVGLARLNLELERSNDELDSFAAVVSHDLKEPLRGIHNYAVFLLEDYGEQLDNEGVHKLQTLVHLSQRMEALIESLLRLSQLGHVEDSMEETNLNEVLTDVLELLQPRLQQTHTTVTVTGPLPTVRGNQVRVQEVFNNLITNAMRYNDHPEKQVIIGLAPGQIRGPRGTGNPDDFCVISVRDNGIGIPAEQHDTIFKLFKRLHGPENYGGGTGAGLAIARRMVEKQGGELWVDSVVGEGATFHFSLAK